MKEIISKDTKELFAEPVLVNEIREMIKNANYKATVAVNIVLTNLYWQIGNKILTQIFNYERAEYGEMIVSTLSGQLEIEFGKGYSTKNLRHMIKFAESFPDISIVSTLSRQLSWSHFKEIIYIKDELKQKFYTEMCRIENWSVRILRDRINSMLYERTALSRKPEELIEIELRNLRETENIEPNMILKDPYILDFLGMKDHYFEKNLEDTILREIELFLLELGSGFSFIERQKRISIDNEDFYIDLLFYNRKL